MLWTEAIKWNFTKFLVGSDGTVSGAMPRATSLRRSRPTWQRGCRHSGSQAFDVAYRRRAEREVGTSLCRPI